MDSSILYEDIGTDGPDRVAGVYGKDLHNSEKYSELIEIAGSADDLWNEILDYTPFEEFVTVNIEGYFFDQVAVTVSDGRVTRTSTYSQIDGEDAEVAEDVELFERYVEDVLEEEDIKRLNSRNLRGVDGKVSKTLFKRADQLNPQEGFR